jgi:hypothetical protein
VSLIYYSEWQDIQALRPVVTEMMVGVKAVFGPERDDGEDPHPETLMTRLSTEN